MAPLALIVYVCFVVFLLRLDRKLAPKVSGVLWIPTVWLLYTTSRPMGAWFRAVAADAPSSPLDQLFLGGLLCVGLFVLFKRSRDWPRLIRTHSWVIAVLGYMLVSILWSEIPLISFKRWIRELAAVTMAFLVAIEQNPRLAAECVLRRMVYIHIPTSIFLIKYLPDYGVQFNRWLGDMMWTGVGMQKNGLGVLCLLSAMLLAWTFVRRRQRRIPRVKYQAAADLIILGITLVLLRGPRGSYGSASGYSSTSIFALVVGFATFLRLLWMKRHGRYLGANLLTVIMALVIAFGTLLPIGIGFAPRNFTSALGRDATLTGRTDIWAKLMPVVEQRSMLGCGFGGFWTPETIAEHIVTEAHNGYLAVLMELGIVGLLLMTMFLLALGRKAAKILTYDFDWGSLCVCCFLMAVVHNISEASMNSFTTPLTAVLLLLSVGIPSRAMYQQMRKQESGVSGGEVSLNGQKRGNA